VISSDTMTEELIWISKWADKKIKGKSFKKALTYENVSLWWFVRPALHDRIIAALKGVEVPSGILKILRTKAAKCAILAKFLIRAFYGRLITWGIGKRKNKIPHRIMVVSYSVDWQDVITSKSKNDVIFGNLITELKKRNNEVIALDQDTSTFMDFSTLFEKTAYGGRLWRPVETYLTSDIVKKSLKASKELEKIWKELKNDPDFINSLKYKNFQLFDLLKDDFEGFFRYHFFFDVLCIELMKRTIDVEKPDLILLQCEYCSLGRAAVIAGKLKSVPTLALQHGSIGPCPSAGYYYTPDEISNRLAPQYCPLPDKTAVYGDYTKRVLTEICNYPPESVVVTGQPRYDVLTKIDKILDKEKIFEQLDLDPRKKTVVLATGMSQAKYGYPDHDEPLLDATFKALNEIPNIQLAIKVHPRDDGELQRRMVAERGLKDALITKGKLYELLYLCDVLMTFCSTVATEALILDKPVITVNLTGEPDPMPYAESGAAIGVCCGKDLAQAIKDALENPGVRKKLEENRRKFLCDHVYKIDGGSSRRVVDLIEQMIKRDPRRDMRD